MSKLRVIKERSKFNEDEQDLRGLGSCSILTNTHIEPYIIFNLNETNTQLDKFLMEFNCKITIHPLNQSIKVVTTNNNHPNFKVNCLFLFNLGIHLFQKKITDSIDFGETNWLHKELYNALIDKKINLKQDYQKIRNHESGFLLSPVFTHALSQAGYKIQASLEYTFLNEQQVLEVIDHLKITGSRKNISLRSA